MHIEEIRYDLWQIISKARKTLFGYRITVLLLSGKDSVKIGDTVYIDTNRNDVHSCKEDIPAVVYRIAWSNWCSAYYQKVSEIAEDKTIYNPDMKDPPETIWARLWIRTKGKIKDFDIVYRSPDRPTEGYDV